MSDELAHYGVKGMKWGRRRTGPSRGELREMDRAAREKQRVAATKLRSLPKPEKKKTPAQNDKEILTARLNQQASYAKIREAKRKYKNDKRQIGKVAAREILNKSKEKPLRDIEKAFELTQGEARQKMIDDFTRDLGNLLTAVISPSSPTAARRDPWDF